MSNVVQQESTLTTPSDRNPEQKFRLDQTAPVLTPEQTEVAFKELNQNTLLSKYPKLERRYVDPVIDLQKIGLVSFIPAKGATPNEQGIYGFAKLRGNYASEQEANERAEYLVRNIDSYHQIYHTYVGRPFPLTTGSEFSKEVARIELQKSITESVSADVKKKRDQEQKEIEEIKQREKELLADTTEKKEEDKADNYTTLQVKRAQLSFVYLETEKKLEQMVGLIAKCRKDIQDLEMSNPELKEQYYEKYISARQKAGLSTNVQENEQNFMKFLVQDVKIRRVEEEYQRLYGSPVEKVEEKKE